MFNNTQVQSLSVLKKSTGSDKIGFKLPVTLAVVRVLSKKISESFSVTDFGAIPEAEVDNTIAVQNAMNSVSSVGVAGGKLFFPQGVYNVLNVSVPSNIELIGEGEASDIRRLSGGAVTDVALKIFGTATVAPFDPELNAKNITISNLRFSGTVESDGFSEFKHLIMCQGVTNLLIEKCSFIGWQGDAVVVRSGNVTAQAKNISVTIRDSFFDGLNNDNRNAITMNDCDGFCVINNKFKNCTRPNMPGAIDIEPNIADNFVVIRNVVIERNSFKNIGGNVGAIALYLPDNLVLEAQSIKILNNDMNGVYRGFHIAQAKSANVTDATEYSNVIVAGNNVRNSTDRDFWLYGMRGITLDTNHFEGGAGSNRIGWLSQYREVSGVKLINNTFRHSSKTDGTCIQVYGSNRLEFIGNTFDNIGNSGGGFGVPIAFSDGYSALPCAKIKIIKNTIINNEGLTTGAVSVSGTITAGDNYQYANEFAGLSSSFVADYTDYGERSIETGITALAGGQAGAYQLTKNYNQVTGGAAFDSVKLPSSVGDGRSIRVKNANAASIQIYPFSNDNLGNGVNAPVSLSAGGVLLFVSIDAVNWLMM